MEYIHDKLISSILKKDNNRTPTKYIRKLKSGKFPNVLEYLGIMIVIIWLKHYPE